MIPTLRLGRVAGIDIDVHWTWPVVAVLLGSTLAGAVFPASNPGLGAVDYVAMALAAIPLVVASLILHELAHALQAHRGGARLVGTTLWPFGGVPRLRRDPPCAEAELRIAVAGPAASLLLGIGCLVVSVAAELPAAVDGVVHWLGYANLVVLAFNLLPALPLDGGRILRAALWRARDDRPSATRTAAVAGRGVGVALIVLGFLLAVYVGGLGGLWTALLGFLLASAAEAELERLRTRAALDGVRVRDVMVRRPVTVRPDIGLDRFLDETVLAHHHTAYPVCEPRGDAIGVITYRDALDLAPERRRSVTVGESMTPLERALVVDADRHMSEVMPWLRADVLHRALVRVDDRVTGLLSLTDATRVAEILDGGERPPTLAEPPPGGRAPAPAGGS